MSQTFCGFITIIGRPNVGKSTLLNHILGEKVSITANKPQTTRHRIMGVKTDGKHQAIYLDTPGMHNRSDNVLNKRLNKTADAAMHDVDLLCFMVEAGLWTEQDERILEKVKRCNCPVLLLINKIDRVKQKDKLLPFINKVSQQFEFSEIFLLSAETGEQVAEFSKWVNAHLPESMHFFPSDQITDKNDKFMTCELVREQLTRRLGDELPYGIGVEIEHMTEKKNCLHIHCLIWVTRESHKHIIIGKGGQQLKVVGQQARVAIEKVFKQKIFLGLWVKVKENWVDNEGQVSYLGYDE